MYVGSFEFQVEYNSRYGAFVNQIDSTPDKGKFYWLVQQNHMPAKVGVSEAIIFEDHRSKRRSRMDLCGHHQPIRKRSIEPKIAGSRIS
jgi:hypothetical protein